MLRVKEATMKNRTRYTLAAILVAFSLSGCEGPVALVDFCPNLPGFQATGPCEVPTPRISVVTSFATANPSVIQGEVLPCPNIALSVENLPSGAVLDTIHILKDGRKAVCGYVGGVGPQMLADSPVAPVSMPVSMVVEVGENTLTTTITLRGTTIKAVSSPLPFTVVKKVEPDLLVVTTFEGIYPASDCGEIWYGADTAGTSLKRVTNSCGDKRDAQLSPDGQTLIYISNRRLWRANADGTNSQVYSLIWEGNVLEVGVARISPDGKKIAVSVGISGWIGVHVFVVNVDGTGLDKVMSKEDSFGTTTVQWLPSGELILGLNLWDEARTSVLGNEYLKYDTSTRSKVSLFTVGRGEWSTAQVLGVDPQGGWFALWDYYGSRKIGFVATDGSGLYKTIDRAVWDPFVCSRGTEICFETTARELWSMDLDGQNVRKRFETVGRWIYSVTVWVR
ncbi:MAG: hypothetical protein ABIF06_00165 [bacterium]